MLERGVVGIEATGRFIEEQDGGAGNQFAGNPNTSLLTTRDTTALAFFRTNEGVTNVVNAEFLLDLEYSLLFGSTSHVAGKPEQGTGQNRLMDGKSREHGVLLVHKSNDILVVAIINLFSVDIKITMNLSALVFSSEYIEECRLSCSRGTHNGSDFSWFANTADSRENLFTVKIVPCQDDDSNQEQRASSDNTSDKRRVDLFHRSLPSWHLCLVEALASVAVEEDAGIADQCKNQGIHLGFFESAVMGAAVLLSTLEPSRALNRLIEEISQINRSILTTEHSIRNAAAADLVTFVGSGVLGLLPIGGRVTFGKVTVERLDSINPN
ncbi:hypothetical protein HG531_013878 [Fusarium graminearum]|nr:hypothetical protein HG531_013878 [Fusarium graminearum]